MSSSRSSDEDKTKKKPAAVLAEEVCGRAAKKDSEIPKSQETAVEEAVEAGPSQERPSKHVRSKSATLASMIIDNAQGFKHDASSQFISPTSLISEPARPQTSTAADLESVPAVGETVSMKPPTVQALIFPKPTLIRYETRSSTLRLEPERRPSILGSLNSWMPWSRPTETMQSNGTGRLRSASYAEGSLRELLKATDADRKGKNIDRAG